MKPERVANFIKAINKGLLKTFSKMGISTLQSYRGAQVFEAIGLDQRLVERYFTGTVSRIEGVGLDVLARGGHPQAPARLPAARRNRRPSWRSAATISTARAASITWSIRRPSPSCSTRCGRRTSRLSRNTRT